MKKRPWTITPYFLVFSVAILAMAIFSVRWNIYIFYIEIAVAVLSIALVAINLTGFQKYISRVVKKTIARIKDVDTDYLERFSFPVVVVGSKNDIIWYNTKFKKNFSNGRYPDGDNILQYIDDYSIEDILKNGGSDVRYEKRRYTVFANEVDSGSILYYIDDTFYKNTAQEYRLSRPAIATVLFDNKDEFERDNGDEEYTAAVIMVENAIQKWATSINGIMKRVSSGRYTVIIEERALMFLEDNKFTILEEIRNMKLPMKKNATISLGVGRGAKNFKECELRSKKALDMALGRGGDQAAVFDGTNFRFYGGISQAVERHSKVRARVIAGSISEQVKQSDKVFIMGHRNSDLDSLGAGVGMHCAITKGLGKPATIIVRKEQTLATPLIDLMKKSGQEGMFISPDDAERLITDKSLLIIADTHSPSFLESVEIYELAKRVVVIDHHRMMVDRIENAVVFFHEPYASSACEMVSEIVRYIDDTVLDRIHAEALLAGIMLDTKNFVIKTGVRTFEAAAYLRQRGADTVEVKRFFSNSLDTYKAKAAIVADAEIYNNCAVVFAQTNYNNMRIICAQAADELLGLEDVYASFVAFELNGVVNISARSMGRINVQLIMEEFDGGGHLTMAGAQISNMSVYDVKKKLIKTVSQVSVKED